MKLSALGLVVLFAVGCVGTENTMPSAPPVTGVSPSSLAGKYTAANGPDLAKGAMRGEFVTDDAIFRLELKTDGSFTFGDPRIAGQWAEKPEGVVLVAIGSNSRYNNLNGKQATGTSGYPVVLTKTKDGGLDWSVKTEVLHFKR